MFRKKSADNASESLFWIRRASHSHNYMRKTKPEQDVHGLRDFIYLVTKKYLFFTS